MIVTGARFIETDHLAPSAWEGPFAVLVSGMLIFVAYEGFELIANAAEDVRDYRRPGRGR